MKKNLHLKKLSVFLILILFMYSATAEILVDGVYYNIKSANTVEVTCRGFDENGTDGWMYFTSEKLYTGNIRIPSTITYNHLTYSVTAIGDDAFAGSKLLTTLILPSSVVTIGSGVFSLCNSLASIQVEEDNPVFFSENDILYKKNPVSLFYVPRNIQGDVEMNSEITSIPSSAFQYCSGITSVTIPDKVTSIADGAFNSCTALTEVNFSTTGKVATIGVQAFGKCSGLMLVNIPASVTTIEASAFVNCNNLTYLLFNEGLKTIGKMAFYGCESISSVQLPSTLLSIGDKAFDLCENLATVKNKTDFVLELKSETYGCVAKYATEIINEDELTGTFDIAENRDIKIWYNSTADEVFAEIKDFMGNDYVCEIYSLRGDLIEKQRIVSSLTQIDMSKVKGLFFVLITENGGNLYTTKVSK